MLINKLALIGVGLIGGSLARGLKAAGVCRTISGYDRNKDELGKALALGVIDDCPEDLSAVVADADLLVLATPPGAMENLFRAVADKLDTRTVVTDVGSVKGSIVASARIALGEKAGSFVPGHPVAGTEMNGVEASFATLFRDHLVILTPLDENPAAAIQLVSRMWEACGAKVLCMPVDYHDQVLAATSHLPHMLAYALVDCLAAMDESEEVFRFAAGGFRDFTRIASSNPEMWSDVCVANRDMLLQVLERFRLHLEKITRAISGSDSAGLLEIFSRARQARDEYLSIKKDAPL